MRKFAVLGGEKTKPIKANFTYKQPLRANKKAELNLSPAMICAIFLAVIAKSQTNLPAAAGTGRPQLYKGAERILISVC